MLASASLGVKRGFRPSDGSDECVGGGNDGNSSPGLEECQIESCKRIRDILP